MDDAIERRVVAYPDLKSPEFAAINPLKKVPAFIRADGTCVVLVPKEEHQQQGAAGLVGRARERGVGVASVEWVKQCLLQQKNLPTRGFPPPQ